MREPVSTLTNAAYVIAGAYAAASGAWLYAATLALLGIASGGFHAGLGRMWQYADECAMYLALCVLSSLYGVPVEIALLAAAVLIAECPRISSFTAVPTLAGINVVLIAMRDPWLALGLACMAAVAFLVRQTGEKLGEESMHGLWHLLTALVLAIAANPHNALH